MKKIACLMTATLFTVLSGANAESDGEDLVRAYCTGCHGKNLSGGMGPSLVDVSRLDGISDEALALIIRNGVPNTGMPAFGRTLSDRQIASVVDHLRRASTADNSRVIEAETLAAEHSSGYEQIISETTDVTYIGYFDAADFLCYENVDLTGVRSIDILYATTGDPPGRFAVMVSKGNESPANLGEGLAPSTGGWEAFRWRKVGLSRRVEGPHRLCFTGVHQAGILNLDKFALTNQPGENEGITQFEITEKGIVYGVPEGKLSAAGHGFYLEPVGLTPNPVAAMDFLPDGTALVGQRDGTIWLFKDDKRTGSLKKLPEAWHQDGLISIDVHPGYAENRLLYLTYEHRIEKGTMTRVIRGRLDGLRLTDLQPVFSARPEHYSESRDHFGSALVFHRGNIYFSVGDRGVRESAQDLTLPSGKVHRLREDGQVPSDNPFIGNENAYASIWSYGHRNPQGLAVHPLTGDIWSAEHGPRGGDEINRIKKSLNYGWPLVSHGTNYDGTIISESPYREGIEPPLHHWTPAIAVSRIAFYTGKHFPKWRNHLLVGSLAERQLRLVRIDGNRVVGDELMVGNLARFRSVRMGPDGYAYVAFNNPNGMVYRLVPDLAKKKR